MDDENKWVYFGLWKGYIVIFINGLFSLILVDDWPTEICTYFYGVPNLHPHNALQIINKLLKKKKQKIKLCKKNKIFSSSIYAIGIFLNQVLCSYLLRIQPETEEDWKLTSRIYQMFFWNFTSLVKFLVHNHTLEQFLILKYFFS